MSPGQMEFASGDANDTATREATRRNESMKSVKQPYADLNLERAKPKQSIKVYF
jgi:hypothetical protein